MGRFVIEFFSKTFAKCFCILAAVQMMGEFMQPLEVSDATLGLEAMADVGPGGHFFGTQHTLDRYETAFYDPMGQHPTPAVQWAALLFGSRLSEKSAVATLKGVFPSLS